MSRFKSSTVLSKQPSKPHPSVGLAQPIPPLLVSAPLRSEFRHVAVEPPNAMRTLGLVCGLIFIFVQISFLHEVIAIRLGLHSYLPLIFGSLAGAAIVFSGGVQRLLANRTFLWMVAFFAWLLLSLPFSNWKSGSTDVVMGYFSTQILACLILGGLVLYWQDMKRGLFIIAAGGFANALVARFMRKESSERLALDGIVTIGNANDFAAQLILILPIFLYVAALGSVPKVIRLLMAGLCAYCLYLTLLTGSRGSILSIGLLSLFFLVRSKGTLQKLVALVLVPAGIAIMFTLLPATVQDRLSTIYKPDSSDVVEAAASAEGRTHLLKESALIALQHPLFGVGVGQFSGAQASKSKSQGGSGGWVEAHNAYTQIASEAGIPALIFLLGALISAFRGASRIYREARIMGHPQVEKAALAVMSSLVGFSGAAFFLSLGYRFYFPMLVGLSIGLVNTAQIEFRRVRPAVVDFRERR